MTKIKNFFFAALAAAMLFNFSASCLAQMPNNPNPTAKIAALGRVGDGQDFDLGTDSDFTVAGGAYRWDLPQWQYNAIRVDQIVQPIYWLPSTYAPRGADFTIPASAHYGIVQTPFVCGLRVAYWKIAARLNPTFDWSANFSSSFEIAIRRRGGWGDFPLSNFLFCYDASNNYAYIVEYRNQYVAGPGSGYTLGQTSENAGESFEWESSRHYPYDPTLMREGRSLETKLMWVNIPDRFRGEEVSLVFKTRDSWYSLEKRITIAGLVIQQ